jgi:hypothetical protein
MFYATTAKNIRHCLGVTELSRAARARPRQEPAALLVLVGQLPDVAPGIPDPDHGRHHDDD